LVGKRVGIVDVREVRDGDIDYLVEHMREADKLEVLALATDLREVLTTSIEASSHVWAAELEGRLISIWGFVPVSLIGNTAIPWMLGTDDISRIPSALTKIARGHIAEVRQIYPRLKNIVDVRNTYSWRWLKRLGFVMRDPVPMGRGGELYFPFDMGMSDV
jgi:hypothetical protein